MSRKPLVMFLSYGFVPLPPALPVRIPATCKRVAITRSRRWLVASRRWLTASCRASARCADALSSWAKAWISVLTSTRNELRSVRSILTSARSDLTSTSSAVTLPGIVATAPPAADTIVATPLAMGRYRLYSPSASARMATTMAIMTNLRMARTVYVISRDCRIIPSAEKPSILSGRSGAKLKRRYRLALMHQWLGISPR